MIAEMKYGALSGKTRAMFGRLLHNEDYIALMQKKNVSEVVSYLKNNTHYQSILSNIEETEIHRARFENLLKKDLVNDYGKLLKFTNGNLKEFLKLLYFKIEIESFKLIFRAFETGHVNQSVLENSLLFFADYDKLDIPKLALSKNTDEFLSRLRGTVYYVILRPFASENNETRLFSMEMALDQFYLRCIQNDYKKLLNVQDRAIMKELAGVESDVFNIFWIYRSKTFYKIDEEVIKSYTLPLIHKLNKNTMDALIKSKDFEEYISILKETPYSFLFEGNHELLFEHNYSEFMYRLYRTRFRSQPFTIACIVSYMRMKEVELSNIISIVEGIRYKLSEENIRKYVVGMNF